MSIRVGMTSADLMEMAVCQSVHSLPGGRFLAVPLHCVHEAIIAVHHSACEFMGTL